MIIKVELTNGEIKEYEIKAQNMPYIELMQKLKEDNISPDDLKNIKY